MRSEFITKRMLVSVEKTDWCHAMQDHNGKIDAREFGRLFGLQNDEFLTRLVKIWDQVRS